VPDTIKLKKKEMITRFLGLTIIIPLLIFLGGYTASLMHEKLALLNPKVRMARELIQANENPEAPLSLDVESFKASGKQVEELMKEVDGILSTFKTGAWILGGFIGLIIGVSLASLAVFRYREDYEPNKGTCLSCARCVDFCPVKPDGSVSKYLIYDSKNKQ
jgi:ferredoxin